MATNTPEVSIRVMVENGQVKVGVNQVKTEIKSLGPAVQQASAQAAGNLEPINAKLSQIQDNLQMVGQFAGAYLGFSAIKNGLSGLVQAQMALQQIQNGLQAASGSAAGGAQEFAFLSDMAERVGVRLVDAGNAYAAYYSAAKAANLTTAETRDLFQSTAEAGAVFNLSAQQVDAALLALQQMMAQGTIRTQELNYQLGTALPGSFAKFKQLVESRKLVPDFNKALSEGAFDVKTFAPVLSEAIQSLYSQEDLNRAADDLTSQFAKMENAWVKFKASFVEGEFQNTLSNVIGGLAGLTNALASANKGIGGEAVMIGTAVAAFSLFAKGTNVVTDNLVKMGQSFVDATGITKAAAAAQVISTEAALTEAKAQQQSAASAASAAAVKVAQTEANAALTASALANAEATLASTRANVAAGESTAALTAAENLAAAAAARHAEALQAATVAKANATIANRTLATSNTTVATATSAAGLAAARTAGQMSVMTIAAGALRTGLGGVLSLLGGWPGVVLAAGAALIYFATRASEAKKATDEFITSLDTSFQKMTEFAGRRKELSNLEVLLRKQEQEGNTAEAEKTRATIRRLSGDLADQRRDLETQQVRDRAAATDRERKLKEAQDALNKQASVNAGPGGLGSGSEANDARLLNAYQRAQERVTEAQRALDAANQAVNLSQKNLDASREAAARGDAARALDQAKAQVKSATEASDEAKRKADQAIEELRNPEAKVTNAIKNAETEFKKKNPNLDVSTGEGAELLKQYTDAAAQQVRVEQAQAAAKKEVAGAEREKNSEAKEAERLARMQQKAENQTADAIRNLDQITTDATNGLREQNQARDQMEASLRQIEDQIYQTTRQINESKLSDAEKATSLQSIAEKADLARAAVQKLGAAEEQRARDELRKAAREDNNADSFQLAQDALLRKGDDKSLDQANRNEIDNYYQNKLTGLQENFKGRLETSEYTTSFQELQANWETALANMSTVAQQRGDEIQQNLSGAWSNALMGMLSGTMTWQQGLQSIFTSIYQSFLQTMVVQPLADMAARWLRETILQQTFLTMQTTQQATASAQNMAIKQTESTAAVSANAATAASGAAASQASIPYAGPALAIAAMIAIFAAVMAIQKKKDGGSIRGPGTGTSDSVPILASNGEYMIKASSVQKYGVGFLDSVNEGSLDVGKSPMGRVHTPKYTYADGGLVTPMPGSNSPKEGDRAAAGVRVVNVLDPRLFEDYINSAEGEKSILNVIEKNPRRVKQSIG
ncbi:tape measure protein [Stenotrophomonas phage vB_SmaS_DLP_5]|uniref:Tape measure protein n=1 Tax=Stenotrophomonas phage vB_SmaS_DLP_5 TaxID=2044561 RepID=A0A2D2W2J5_9CAUD|nr:tail length tape measure protein [Stenotrophomonas phage vB_SmaS_DLP_5]ATS92270.1 tape measure protein [Stenotrophomonas phage vB_SmaS_DLP_5]